MTFPGFLPKYHGSSLPPAPTTGLLLWLKTPISGGVNGSPLTGDWTDDSGNGHDYTFGTDGGNNPVYRTNQVNGLPAVDFATNGLLNATTFFDGSDFTSGGSLYIVTKTSSAVDAHQHSLHSGFGHRPSAGATHYPFTDGLIYEEFLADDTPADSVTPGVTITNWHLYEVLATASSYDLYQNGGNVFTRASNTLYVPVDTHFGWFVGSLVGHYDGLMAEIMIYNVTNNRAAVEAYLMSKYGF